MRRLAIAPLFVLAAGAVLVACGGGGGGGSSTPPPPAPTSATIVNVLTTSPGAPVTLALPALNGFGGSILFPAATAQRANLTETLQTTAPTDGTPALTKDRIPLGARQALAQVPHQTIIYLRLVADGTVTLPSGPAYTFTVPASVITANTQFYVAFFDRLGIGDWILAWEGPAAVSGTTLTFTANASPFTFQPNANTWFALVAVTTGTITPSPTPTPVGSTPTPTPTPTPSPTPTPTPTPSPTPTPTPTPSPTPLPGVLSVQPNPVDVNGLGGSASQTVNVTETGYAGTFGESAPSCSGIATITTSNANGPTALYTVTGVAAGTCTATFTDSLGQSTPTTINVTTNGFVINGKRRH